MNLYMKIKRLFLASIIALTLGLGMVGMGNKIEAGNAAQVAWTATTNGGCWKCVG